MVTSDSPIIRFEGDNFFLSNFYEAEISFPHRGSNIVFPTNEHAFQAAKYRAMTTSNEDRLAYILKVCDAASPNEAKRLGRTVKIDIAKWDSQKVDIMREIVYLKFTQNLDLAWKLVDTGAGMLVEGNNWNDMYWGRVDGRGKNMLGSILMEVRGYFVWRDFDKV